MWADVYTVVWKELKELLFQRPTMRSGILRLLISLAVFGVFLPLQVGQEWISSPITLLAWAWLPYLMVSGIAADLFAGERERHTLETLLASRLPDFTILVGKLCAALVYGMGFTLGVLPVGLATINIAYGKGQLLFFSTRMALAILAITFLISLLSACLGVLISLRAATVRQAQQTFSLALFALFIPFMALQFLPESIQVRMAEWATQLNFDQLGLIAVFIVLVIDLALFAWAKVRFRRARLLLD